MSTMIRSPYLKTDEVAAYLRFEHADGSIDRAACVRFLKAHRVPMKKRGHTLLVHVEDAEAVLVEINGRRKAS